MRDGLRKSDFDLEAIAFDAQDNELGSIVMPLVRREVINQCEGAASLTTCINDLAAAIQQDEIPPIAMLASATEDFTAWGTNLQKALDTDYAVAWAPNAIPDPIPGGRFAIDVDLSATVDPSGRPLLYFPALLRGDPADVEIERVNEEGTQRGFRVAPPVGRPFTS